MNDTPERRSCRSVLLNLATTPASSSSSKDFTNRASKGLGLDSRVSTSGDEKHPNLMETREIPPSESNNQTSSHSTGYKGDEPLCTPGPSSRPRTIISKVNLSNDPTPPLPRLPSFTELKDWSTKEFADDGMEPVYLPEDSPLKGKELARWRKKEVVDIRQSDQFRRDFRSSGKHMDIRFQEERLRKYLGYKSMSSRYSDMEGGGYYSREHGFISRRDFAFKFPNMKSGEYLDR